jgi:hypothetical protein
MIYGELERYPIEIDVKVRIISFWTKLCCGKESKSESIFDYFYEYYPIYPAQLVTYDLWF